MIMRTLIGTEILKVRTVRWPWILLLVQVGLVILGVSGYSIARGDQPIDPQVALGHIGVTSLFTLILGLMAVAGEYRDRTITDTFLVTPRRERVIGAKLVVYTALGFVFAILTAAVAVAITAAWLTARGSTLDIGSAGVWNTVIGAVLWDTGFAAIGVSLGALVPNLTAAIVAGLAWIALVEGLVAQVIGSGLARWLPMAAGQALEGLSVPGRELLAPLAGGLVLAAYAIGLGALAAVATVRRDVT
jgi:ABC-2 type transport system permease protein